MSGETKIPVSMIAAMAENRIIGRDNQMPWHLPQDLKRFRALTSGHPVIMGRKTFESIGKPLPHRENIVITRNSEWKAEGARTATSLEQALEMAREKNPREIFIIGGAEIYRLGLPLADRLYLTLIHQTVEGDAHFPDWKIADTWQERHRELHAAENFQFTYLNLERA